MCWQRAGSPERFHRLGLPALVCAWFLSLKPSSCFRPDGVDPYEVLGLKRTDAIDMGILKRAYRQAALKWHPDKVPLDRKEMAEQKFIGISWAYEVLSDPAKRAEILREPFQSGASGTRRPSGPEAGYDTNRDKDQSETQRDPRPKFSMEEAARVFRNVFGTVSDEYQDLIWHLSQSSTAGDLAHWRRHAEAVAKAVQQHRGGDDSTIVVETQSEDGSQGTRTSHSNKVIRNVDRTASIVGGAAGNHVHGSSGHVVHSGLAQTSGHSAAHADVLSAARVAHSMHHDAHTAAHEAAVRAAQDAHRKALAAASEL